MEQTLSHVAVAVWQIGLCALPVGLAANINDLI